MHRIETPKFKNKFDNIKNTTIKPLNNNYKVNIQDYLSQKKG